MTPYNKIRQFVEKLNSLYVCSVLVFLPLTVQKEGVAGGKTDETGSE